MPLPFTYLSVTHVQTELLHVLRLTRSRRVDKYTEEMLSVKCRGEWDVILQPHLFISTHLVPPVAVNWTLAACKLSQFHCRHRHDRHRCMPQSLLFPLLSYGMAYPWNYECSPAQYKLLRKD